MEQRRRLGGRTCTAFEAHSLATSNEVTAHGGSLPLSKVSAASRVPVHPRNGTGMDKTRAPGRSPAMSKSQVTVQDTKRCRVSPESLCAEGALKRKPAYDTANEDSIASRVAKRVRGPAASGRQFTPESPAPAVSSEQSWQAPSVTGGRISSAAARDLFHIQALHKQMATEKLRREAAETRASAAKHQLVILTLQNNNLHSQLSSKVTQVQQLQQKLDHREAASPEGSPGFSKASTQEEFYREQVKQHQQQRQFNQVAGAERKAHAVHREQQAEITPLERHETIATLKLPEFPEDAVTILGKVGDGGCATVHVAQLNGTKVALKRAIMEEGRRGLVVRTQRTEEAMLTLLKHPHIIEGRGKVREAGHDIPSLLLELADSDLLDYQNNLWTDHGESLSPKLQLLVAEHCAHGLQHMHAHGYCHSDMKPDNILLFDSGKGYLRAKIADLGMAAPCDRATGRVVPGYLVGGTESCRRLDVIMDESLAGFSDDMYGYGVCLWTMLTGHCPQQALWHTLLQRVDTPWFARSARIQQERWRCGPTPRRHCVLAYCNPHIRLRLQVPEDEARRMPRSYVELINSLLDPRDDPVTGRPGITWDHILATIRKCWADLSTVTQKQAA